MQACQQSADSSFLIALLVPVVTAVLAFVWIARSPSAELLDDGTVFEDPDTGAVFGSAEGVAPERDRKVGILALPRFTPSADGLVRLSIVTAD
jgi:hypothetical protein